MFPRSAAFIFTLSIFFILTGAPVPAQSLTLKGNVFDAATGEPLQGAGIFISNNHITYSNADGAYRFGNIEPGKYSIRVSRIGYKALNDEVILDAGFDKTHDFRLQSSPIPMDEILVSSNRYERTLRESPYSEIAVSAAALGAKPMMSIPEALKTEQGISIVRDGMWGADISIRGLSRENIVTLIDGSRIATSTDVAARLSMVDMNDIERIEVIKGASSALYGSGATGGIVNIVTRTPQFSEMVRFSGLVSSGYNSVNQMSQWSGVFFSGGSFWSSKFAGAFRNAKNTRTPSGELKNSQFRDYSLSGAVHIAPADQHLLKINYQLFKATDVGIPGASVFPDIADVRYPDEKREMVSAGYEIQNLSPMFYKLNARYTYQAIDRNVENIPHTVQNIPAAGTTPAKRVSVLKITPSAQHLNNNFQLQGNFLIAASSNLIVGVDYWDRTYNGSRQKYQLIEVLTSQGNTASVTNKIIGEKPLPDCNYRSLGIFAQNETEIIREKISLSAGARYDIITVSGDSALNPVYETVNGVTNYTPAGQKTIWKENESRAASYSGNIGARYIILPELDATVSIGYSFRSPSLEERFQYIDQGSYVRVGTPDLKPEKGKSADFGIRFYSPQLKIIVSAFYNYFNDLVAEIPGVFEGRNAYIKRNIGEAKTQGFDLRADYNFYHNFVLYSTASYVKGSDITANAPLADMPPFNGSFGIRFGAFGAADIDVSTAIFAAQNRVATGELPTAGYAVCNLFIGFKPINFDFGKLTVSTGAENIFNKEYRDHLATSRGLIKFEPGRNVFLKLNVNW